MNAVVGTSCFERVESCSNRHLNQEPGSNGGRTAVETSNFQRAAGFYFCNLKQYPERKRRMNVVETNGFDGVEGCNILNPTQEPERKKRRMKAAEIPNRSTTSNINIFPIFPMGPNVSESPEFV